MSRTEFGKLAATLHSLYGSKSSMNDEKVLEVWYGMLKDLNYTVCANAVAQLGMQNKFMPTVAEIREKCASITAEQLPDWDEAWGMVLMSVRNYGYMREAQAIESLPEPARTVARRMGYQNICQSENIATERANFREAYKSQLKYFERRSVLSDAVRREQDRLVEGCAERLRLESRGNEGK